VLPDPETMARAIEAIPSHQPSSRTYQVMVAVSYYAGLRPSEVVMLRSRALQLPSEGWGRIDVVEADIDFDVPGEPKTGIRSVPISPVLVTMLQHWTVTHDFGPDDLLFRTRTGRRPTASNWARTWQRALRAIGHPSLRVYDCRHAAATMWLQAGVRSVRSLAGSATASRHSSRPTSVRSRATSSWPTSGSSWRLRRRFQLRKHA